MTGIIALDPAAIRAKLEKLSTAQLISAASFKCDREIHGR
jgi:hypothetical protein